LQFEVANVALLLRRGTRGCPDLRARVVARRSALRRDEEIRDLARRQTIEQGELPQQRLDGLTQLLDGVGAGNILFAANRMIFGGTCE
jgi:hypothetical protein